MKILWFSHFIPYPPQGGNRQRSFNLIRELSKTHYVQLVAFNLDSEPKVVLEQHRKQLGQFCREVEFWDLPTKWRSNAWRLKLLVSPFSVFPYACNAFWSGDLGRAFEQKLNTDKFDLVHFDSIDLARYFAVATGAARVLNHHNCESAMTKRRAAVESNFAKKCYLAQQAQKIEALETTICEKFDVNTVVSADDGDLLKANSPKARIHVVENGTDTEFFVPHAEREEANSLVFAGSLNWYPNVSGLEFFLQEVWPLVKKSVPTAKFYIAGKDPGDNFQKWLEQSSDVTVIPSPADIRPWMGRGSVFVCPILDGGGTRLKLLDAMSMGKAIVSTSIGCEGLGVSNGDHMLIADKPQEFADEVVRLLNDKQLRKTLSNQGRSLVQRRYSWQSIGQCLLDAYESARQSH